MLPFIKTVYSRLYKYSLGSLEKQWDLAVQRKPREGETAEGIAAAALQAEEEEALVVDIQIGFGNAAADDDDDTDEDDNEEEEEEAEEAEEEENIEAADPERLQPADALALQPHPQPNAANPNPDADPNPNAAAQANPWRDPFDHDFISSTDIVGALFFPFCAAACGELLKRALPSRFVTRGLGAKGLFTEKWGRSLVGGCAFVVLKDVVTLYCKWRRAKEFGKRRIVDWRGVKEGR